MAVPIQCQALKNEINGLKQERTDLQAELQTAPTGSKAGLVAQIKNLNAMISEKSQELNACIAKFGGESQPIICTLSGEFSLRTSVNFTGEPFQQAVSWGFLFNDLRTIADVTTLPDIVFDTTALANQIGGPFSDVVFGSSNTTTIKRTGGGRGTYSKPTNNLAIPLTFLLDQSRDALLYEEDSTLSIVLSTSEPSGSPVSSTGQVSLAGSGVFSKGILEGITTTIIVQGRFTPTP
jgi:hypothetical protein